MRTSMIKGLFSNLSRNYTSLPKSVRFFTHFTEKIDDHTIIIKKKGGKGNMAGRVTLANAYDLPEDIHKHPDDQSDHNLNPINSDNPLHKIDIKLNMHSDGYSSNKLVPQQKSPPGFDSSHNNKTNKENSRNSSTSEAEIKSGGDFKNKKKEFDDIEDDDEMHLGSYHSLKKARASHNVHTHDHKHPQNHQEHNEPHSHNHNDHHSHTHHKANNHGNYMNKPQNRRFHTSKPSDSTEYEKEEEEIMESKIKQNHFNEVNKGVNDIKSSVLKDGTDKNIAENKSLLDKAEHMKSQATNVSKVMKTMKKNNMN